ncbi:MAG: NAD(P)H-hydrate dehydratase [Gemmatimonadaceae bacterium]
MKSPRDALVRVTSAAESATLDAAAIAAGTPARELMRRAGVAAAKRIAHHLGALGRSGVAVYAGSGNNGGDAWVVARELARRGFTVRVSAAGIPSGADTIAARDEARRDVRSDPPHGDEVVVVDGLLGTGSRGAPRGEIATAINEISAARARGARVVSLDVPSGVDANSGNSEGAVRADLTLAFGSMKRGLLVAREMAGVIEVLDIGVYAPRAAALPRLVDGQYVRSQVRPLTADAHKGIRKKVAIIGGSRAMAGAVILAGRAAFRSGVGMIRTSVARESVAPVQAAMPEASAFDWPADDAAADEIRQWADVLVIGPGLGGKSREIVERMLAGNSTPVVIDADALSAFAGEAPALGALLARRPAILTPHPAELGRLAGSSASEVLVRRFEVGGEVARITGAVVLSKGTPTVCTSPDGSRLVSAAGNAALAVGGSGDLLSGVVATLFAQIGDPHIAAACAAWAHGRASELARGGRRSVRGLTLEDVTRALGDVWEQWPEPLDAEVLASLPAAGDLP